jgi:ApbE superfamily uncharacterized protein (UPF0280 family)
MKTGPEHEGNRGRILYTERTYREGLRPDGLVTFRVAVRQTDLWISAEKELKKEARDIVLDLRHQLEAYIKSCPGFMTSLSPLNPDPLAPPMIKEMIEVTRRLNVGPMASVAGAIAQHVGKALLGLTDQIIVENGGDIFIQARRPVTVSIFAGASSLSGKIGIMIPERQMPAGVCSSSAKIGHSLSMGMADVVCIISPSASAADAAATSIGNRIKTRADLEKTAAWANQMEDIIGGVVIVEEEIAAWGDVEIVAIQSV